MKGATREESLKATEDAVRAEISSALARKTSLEARGAGLVTGAIGIATLFLAIRLQADLAEQLAQVVPGNTVLVSLSGVALVIIAGLVAAMPLPYPSNDGALYRQYADEIARGETHDHRIELVRAQARALDAMIRSNGIKSLALMVGFIVLVASIGGLSAAIIGVLTS